jgi:hypothetical protein
MLTTQAFRVHDQPELRMLRLFILKIKRFLKSRALVFLYMYLSYH